MLRSHEQYPSKRPQPEKAKRDKRKLKVDPIDQIKHDREENRVHHLWNRTYAENMQSLADEKHALDEMDRILGKPVGKFQLRKEILEKTDLGNQEHHALVEKWDTFTEQELARTRAEIDDIIFPRYHGKTPLPFPRE